MTCNQSTFLMERRWDGKLDAEETRALDEHVSGCPACRAESRAIAAADLAFLSLPVADPPVDIAAAVSRRIAREAPAEPHRAWFWGLFAFAAMAAALLWHAGITPVVVWNSPPVALLAGPVESLVGGWLKPVSITLGTLSPALAALAPIAAVLAALELGLAGLFIIRRVANVS
jgi:anti-sigma factor RsiW